ncbi:MAG TPA: phage tail protein, partial [Burkholderiaceae bacterium]|nr:phage tail protein [Burkholderiaceae bacterium]
GYPVCGVAWAFAWQVNAPANTINPFLAGVACAGEPLSSSNNEVLQCELSHIAPAHTTIIFEYH